jgi:nitrogen fixation/metabolism regulation signal transduction histidine kinase
LERRYRNNSEGFEKLLYRCTQTIITEVEGLRHLLDEFSLLAKMPVPRVSPVNLRGTLDATLDLFGELPAHIDCQIDFPPNIPPVSADAAHLKRAFLNLIKNALEAMSEDPKGRLTVRAFASGDRSQVFVQFTDTGTGIPPDIRPKLFTPHVSTKKDGMGIGSLMPLFCFWTRRSVAQPLRLLLAWRHCRAGSHGPVNPKRRK